MESIKNVIRDIPDFPKKGIMFKDISPLLANSETLKKTIDIFRDRYVDKNVQTIVGVESRGFIFGTALAYALGTGFVMVRKPGKLPYKTFQKTYSLEYGEDTIQIHQDAIWPGQRLVLIDDLLATGGTMAATLDLIRENFDAEIVEAAFIVELDFLNGREKFKDVPVHSLVHFD
ncbi:MAG: adenine phosphoribosyltransferase [Nitrospinae bacterium CG11_big_fil_rev_8_21_14_0_20_45_15]|nr:MAG: adenine phosphoribosyltransferase [Nitrospinae bacterium CG11_big_fil_rev_8_21_14_0_20_45_15]